MAVRQIKLFADDTAENERRVLSEDAIARKRALAEALRAQSANAGQIESPWEGMAQMSNSLFGALGERRAESEADRRQQALASAMGGIGTGAIDPAKLQMLMELDPELGFKIQLLERERINTEARDAATRAREDAIRREGYGREDARTEAENAREDANAARTRLSPEELAAAGFPPGSVVTVDRSGNYEVEQAAPDPAAPRAPTVMSPGQTALDPLTNQPLYTAPAKPPDPPSLETLAPNATLFDPVTKQPVFTAPAAPPTPPTPTDEEREYDRYARGETEAGRTPMPFLDYQTAVRQAGRPESNVTIDQRGENAFTTAAGTGQAKRYEEIVQQGASAQSMISDIGQLRDIGGRLTTGKSAEITAALGPWAEMLGIDIAPLGDLQAFQSIVSRLAPQMRVPGSGATSDFEMRQFLNSLPTVGRTPEGNALIQNTLESIAQYRIAAADIASKALTGELTREEAEQQLRALPDPMTLWRQNQGGGGGGGGAGGAAEPSRQQVPQAPGADWIDLGDGVRIRPRGQQSTAPGSPPPPQVAPQPSSLSGAPAVPPQPPPQQAAPPVSAPAPQQQPSGVDDPRINAPPPGVRLSVEEWMQRFPDPAERQEIWTRWERTQ